MGFNIKTLFTSAALLLWLALPAFGVPDFAKAIHYTPPPNYGCFELNHDPGDDPFSGNGPGFMFLANDQGSQITFRVGLVGVSIGPGKVLKYQHVGQGELKSLLDESLARKHPGSHAVLEEVGGLPAATWTGQIPMSAGSKHETALMNLNWIQIQSNVVLKVTAISRDPNSFTTLTNSLRSLKIDRLQLFELLQPKKPQLTTSPLNKVEVGFMQWRGRRTAAFVLRSNNKIFSLAAGDGGSPEEPVNECLNILNNMHELYNQSNALVMAIVEIGRIGDGADDYRTSVSFLAETNAATITQIKQSDYRITPLLLAWESWTNREPENFQKLYSFDVNGTLFIRKRN